MIRSIPALILGLSLTAGGLSAGLSDAAPIASLAPLTVTISSKTDSGLQKIAPGEYQCFYLVKGRILGIGSNRAGQLGIGIGAPYPSNPPREIEAPAGVRFVDVAAGGYQSLAADSDGRVWTWGSNLFGQKGDGSPLDRQGDPAPISDGIPARIATDSAGGTFDGVIGVGSGWWFDVALKKDGTVWVWGKNADETSGLAGNGDLRTTAITRPTRVPFGPPASIVQVATNGNFLIALDSKGRVWSWGGGADSKENRGSGSDEFGKPQRLPHLPPIRAVAAGDGFSYALDAAGELWGWGINGTYLGLGSSAGGWVPQPTPVRLAFPEFGGRKVTRIAVSGHTSHVILDDGSLWGWGDSAMGEAGNGAILDFGKHGYSWDWGKFECMVFRPVRIAPQVGNFRDLSSTAMCFYTYATTKDGRIYSWGRNKTGVLGDGVIPTGQTAEHPDSWNVATATQVFPLSMKTREAPSKP
jgi:alpha-tubulin suppressor-like RCC1 family protein